MTAVAMAALLKFFRERDLSKSQADALLNRLARDWAGAFDALCQLLAVSAVVHADESEPTTEVERDYRNLVQELVRLLGAEELFTFVIHPEATGTNNEAERTLRTHRVLLLDLSRTIRRRRTNSAIRPFRHRLRGPARDRRTGRTSKTTNGARRRTILVSVLESLRLHVADFTLAGVLQEIAEWTGNGISRFGRMINASGLPPPESTPLATLFS